MTSTLTPSGPDTPDHLAKAPVRKSARRIRLENLAWQIGIAAVFFALWEYASERWISALLVSKPTRIAQTMWQWTVDGTYVTNIWVTLKATLMGFGAGAIGGMLLGGSIVALGAAVLDASTGRRRREVDDTGASRIVLRQ